MQLARGPELAASAPLPHTANQKGEGCAFRACDRCPHGRASLPHPHSWGPALRDRVRGPAGLAEKGALPFGHLGVWPPFRQVRGRRKFQEKHPLLMAARAGYAPEVPTGGQRPPGTGVRGLGYQRAAKSRGQQPGRRGGWGAACGRRPRPCSPLSLLFLCFPFFFFFGFLEGTLNSCVRSAPSGSCCFRCRRIQFSCTLSLFGGSPSRSAEG